MNRHLVAVKISVIGRADQGMELNCLALNQDGLKRLDTKPVQGWGTVEQNRMLLDNLVQDIPDFRALLFQHLFGALDGRSIAPFFELVVDKGLEQFQGHMLGQPALMQAQPGTDHNDGPARIVHPFAEQILPKTSAFAFEHIGQGLERPFTGPGQGLPAPAVIKQGINCLLEHPLFIANNDVGRAQLNQAFEAVIAVDHPPIQIIQVGGGKASAVQRHEGAEVGRNDRNHFQDHPLRQIAGVPKRVDDLEAFGDLFAARLAPRFHQLGAQLFGQFFQIQLL